MSNINAEIKFQGNDDTFFTDNAAVVYPANIQIFHTDGRYKFTDGVTALSALTWRGAGSSYTLTTSEIGSVINGATSATPNDTDLVMSVESSVAKKNTWAQIKAFLKTYFDSIYTTASAVATQINTALVGYATLSDLVSLFVTARNNTGSTITKGSLVYVSGALGQNPTIALAKADAEATSFDIGIAALDIAINTNAQNNVITNGLISGINTSAFADGDLLYLSPTTAGEITNVAPTSPNFSQFIGFCLHSHVTQGKILVKTNNPIATNNTLSTSNRVSPSSNAVKSNLALKLTASNNLSDLSNIFTSRNNLLIFDLFISTGNQATTSNVATNITGLVTPILTANKRYKITGYILIGCNSSGGVKLQVIIPTGSSVSIGVFGNSSSSTSFTSTGIVASATLSGAIQTTNGANYCYITGEVSLSSTAGTIQFGFASTTNSQTSTVYQLGTHITITQIN